MIVYHYCSRPGCGNLVGAEDTETCEKEFYPGITIISKDEMYCKECVDKRTEFKAPEETYEGDWIVNEH